MLTLIIQFIVTSLMDQLLEVDMIYPYLINAMLVKIATQIFVVPMGI